MAGMLGKTTLPRSQYSTQWFPFLWTPWKVPGWQVIYNIYCHEATCHLWIQVLNTDFFYSVTQVLMPHWRKYLNVCGDIMGVWRVPSKTYAPYTHQSQYTVFSNSVSYLIYKTLVNEQTQFCSYAVINHVCTTVHLVVSSAYHLISK